MTADELAALVRRGEERHRQLRLAGQSEHAFEPHASDNQCDACGREEEYAMHSSRQGRLL